jgi:hypothetical protein
MPQRPKLGLIVGTGAFYRLATLENAGLVAPVEVLC